MQSGPTQYLWGIDLGGTKLEGVVIDSSGGVRPLARLRIPTESSGGYEHILSRIKLLVDRLRAETGLTPAQIGIGTPGMTDPHTGLLRNSNTVCLIGKPVAKELETILAVPVVLDNDANCFALAETKLGAAKGAENVFGVIMGTGVGGGVVVGGRVVRGKQGIAGEWGHNVLEHNGQPCYCGKCGCVETVLSGTGPERYYHRLSGGNLKLPEIAAAAQLGSDSHAQATMDRLVDYFGRALSVVVNILDPDVIVLGGGVSNLDLLYTKGVDSLRRQIFNNRLDTVVARNQLGDSAGVFGAAFLVG